MQHASDAQPGVDALHLIELPDEVLGLILGPKYSPAATTCRQLRTMSRQATKQLVIQHSELRPQLLADKLVFARSLPALRDLTILEMPSDCDAETVTLLANLTNLTRLIIPSDCLSLEEMIMCMEQHDLHDSPFSDSEHEDPWQLYELQDTAASLAAALSGLTRLRELLLSGNALRGNAPEAVAYLTGLTLLDLSDNAVDPANPGMLARLTALQHLDLFSHPRSRQKNTRQSAWTSSQACLCVRCCCTAWIWALRARNSRQWQLCSTLRLTEKAWTAALCRRCQLSRPSHASVWTGCPGILDRMQTPTVWNASASAWFTLHCSWHRCFR